MSALPPKADMCGALAHVRYGPIADSLSAFIAVVVLIIKALANERLASVLNTSHMVKPSPSYFSCLHS
jgi:hypothetical protein